MPDDLAWYGSMAHVPLPPPRGSKVVSETSCAIGNPLPNIIFRELGIEVPIVEFGGRRYIRVSCHLYNDTAQIDRLVSGLGKLLEVGHSGPDSSRYTNFAWTVRFLRTTMPWDADNRRAGG